MRAERGNSGNLGCRGDELNLTGTPRMRCALHSLGSAWELP